MNMEQITFKKFICKLCKYNLGSAECLRLHLQKCGKPKPIFQCYKCDKIFRTETQLTNHINYC